VGTRKNGKYQMREFILQGFLPAVDFALSYG